MIPLDISACVNAEIAVPSQSVEGIVYPSLSAAEACLRSGAWIGERIGDRLGDCASRHPNRVAYVCNGSALTFGELDSQSDALSSALLERGLSEGDKAMFQMGTSLETVIAFYGCVKAGVIPVCAIPQYREVEIGKLAELSQPAVYFIHTEAHGFDLGKFAFAMCEKHGIDLLIASGTNKPVGSVSLDDLVAGRGKMERQITATYQDVVALQLSGGSTGVPKIIPRFHAEYLGHTKRWCDRYRMEEGDVGIWALPLMHNAGMMFALVRPVIYGCTTILQPQWDAEVFFDLIQRHKVNYAFTIGPHAPAIAAVKDSSQRFDLASMKFILTLTGAEQIEKATGIPSINMYGITEGLVLTGVPEDSTSIRHATVGHVCGPDDLIKVLHPGTEEDVADGEMGELCFKGPSSLRGYYKAPEISAESLTRDGYFRSADMVVRTVQDGSPVFRFIGRTRDNINRGGEKFGVDDIETLLVGHPSLVDGKVVAMPDLLYGEKACAFVILKQGAEQPSVKELGGFLAERGLAKFKLPERIEVLEAFPTTRVGKLDRAALRAIAAARVADA